MTKEYINPFVEERRKMLKKTLSIIKAMEEKGKVPYTQLLALIQMRGTSEKTARGYIKVLRDSGYIKVEKGFVDSK